MDFDYLSESYNGVSEEKVNHFLETAYDSFNGKLDTTDKTRFKLKAIFRVSAGRPKNVVLFLFKYVFPTDASTNPKKLKKLVDLAIYWASHEIVGGEIIESMPTWISRKTHQHFLPHNSTLFLTQARQFQPGYSLGQPPYQQIPIPVASACTIARQTDPPPFNFEIFTRSSQLWRQNKKREPSGNFSYRKQAPEAPEAPEAPGAPGAPEPPKKKRKR